MEDAPFTLTAIISSGIINALRLLPVALILVILEHFLGQASRAKGKKPLRTDLGYLSLALFYAPLLRHFATLLVATLLIEADLLRLNAASFAGLPIVVQIAVLLIVRDLLIYARHRVFHGRRLWKFHAIHHSSEQVNWLSTVRFHPIEAMIEVGLNLSLFALLGPSTDAVIFCSLLIGFYDFFIHADLPLTFGPLRFILVSPVYHRWHHSTDREARGKNFAAMFSCIDLLLGTYYMPREKYPEKTGIVGDTHKVPPGLLGQLIYPFVKA